MKRQVALLVIALLAAVPLSASTFVAMSQDELIADADAVVIARVVGQVSTWTESGRLIYTENTLVVEEVLFGRADSVVSVRTLGGQVGDITVEAHGFPTFENDEHVLVFLRNDKNGVTRVAGYQQGHFSIVKRLDGVVLAVPMIEDGTRLLDRQGRLTAEPESVPLESFKAAIRDRAASMGRAFIK